MQKRFVHVLLITALIALSVVLMGGGNDCPKACVAPQTACAMKCGDPLNGTCTQQLECTQGGGGTTGNGGGT